jgi:hypothetical protein
MIARYKFLRLVDGAITSEYGHLVWQVGEWQRLSGEPICCEYGLHCSLRMIDALSFVKGEVVARVECEGHADVRRDKEAWQCMKIVQAWHWKKEDSVALAVFAAEKVLRFYEKRYPGDVRPRKAIGVAKRYLDTGENADAAYAAAAAAYAAADAAAYATAYAAYAAAADAAYAATAAAYAYAAADAAAAAYADAYAADVDAAAAAGQEIFDDLNVWMEDHLQYLVPVGFMC